MEPALRLKKLSIIDICLGALLVCVFLVPFLVLVKEILPTVFEVFHDVLFFALLGKSVFFTMLQAALSALVSMALALLIALVFFSNVRWSHGWWGRALRSLGLFSFSMPGAVWGFLVLFLAWKIPMLPSQGVFALVFAHVLGFTAFVGMSLLAQLESWASAGGTLEIQTARSLGASTPALVRRIIFPVIRGSLKSYFVLVLIWSFSAFSTVLLLAGAPSRSSPEVLLFSALSLEGVGARVAVLFVLQLAVGLAASRFLRARANTNLFDLGVEQKKTKDARMVWPVWLVGLAFACFALLGLPWLLVVWQGLAGMGYLKDLWGAIMGSLVLVVLFGLVSWWIQRALVLSAAVFRCNLILFIGISPVMLLCSWMALPVERILAGQSWLQLPLCALALSAASMPWWALVLDRQLRGLRGTQSDVAQSLGCPESQIPRVLGLRTTADTRRRFLLLGGVAALGDLGASSLLVSDWPLMALELRRLAARYEFQATGSLILVAMVLVLMAVWVDRRMVRE